MGKCRLWVNVAMGICRMGICRMGIFRLTIWRPHHLRALQVGEPAQLGQDFRGVPEEVEEAAAEGQDNRPFCSLLPRSRGAGARTSLPLDNWVEACSPGSADQSCRGVCQPQSLAVESRTHVAHRHAILLYSLGESLIGQLASTHTKSRKMSLHKMLLKPLIYKKENYLISFLEWTTLTDFWSPHGIWITRSFPAVACHQPALLGIWSAVDEDLWVKSHIYKCSNWLVLKPYTLWLKIAFLMFCHNLGRNVETPFFFLTIFYSSHLKLLLICWKNHWCFATFVNHEYH